MILTGDARKVLAELPAHSVQCCVTSPPYFGLRSYNTEPLIWGGGEGCEHEWGGAKAIRKSSGFSAKSTLTGFTSPSVKGRRLNDCGFNTDSATCTICGAWRGSFGAEQDVSSYVAHSQEILRVVKRVLRTDGLVFWNIADSRATSSPGTGKMQPVTWNEDGKTKKAGMKRMGPVQGVPAKSLCLIPQRIAIAAQEDGWYVVSDIIWDKPNPMPESVRDRPSKSYEHILVLGHPDSKGKWFWDQEAERQALTLADSRNATGRHTQGHRDGTKYGGTGSPASPSWYRAKTFVNPATGANLRDVWRFPTGGFSGEYCTACGAYYEGGEQRRLPYREGEKGEKIYRCKCGRDDSWLSHFATFPIELPLRCIKLGSSEWGQCPKCGTAWGRDTVKTREPQTQSRRMAAQDVEGNPMYRGGHHNGWSPRCKCDAGEPIPQTILDCFSGAGTTGLAAIRLGRSYIGIELNPNYAAMSEKRLAREGRLFE